MIFYGVLAYFLLIALGVAIFVLPGSPPRIWHALGKHRDRYKAFLTSPYAYARAALRHKDPRSGASMLVNSCQAALSHPVHSVGVILLLTLPSLTILSLNGARVFEFDNTGHATDPQVAALLEGERLIPPAPLPPEVFTTQEVEISRPDLAHASRNWQQLDIEFTQRLLIVFRLMEERHGYRMALIEGYRSPERQAKLFEQGSHVTKAKANMSYHQYGLAADSAFFRDGKIVISERDPWAMRGYELYGQIAEQLGLTWGGRWQLRDLGHVELRRQNVLGQVVR